MNFNFDNVPSRFGTNCVKWDEAPEGVLPLWVADMDFPTAPCVQEAVIRREEILYTIGVVPAVAQY